MQFKKFILPAILAGSLLALFRRATSMPAARIPAPSNNTYDAIDAYITAHMRRLHIPGAALAIISGDQIVHQRGFGQARPHGETPTPQTPFLIGSLSKSITALAVMQLVEAGKVELDAPVQRYLPWFRVADPQASAQMTLRHLLNQTSGLPMLPSELALADYDDRPEAIERQVRALSTLELSHLPGVQCEYSNFNYNIAGLVVEAVSGETYADYIQKHIYEPLEMRHSYTSRTVAQQNNLAMGHRHWFSLPLPAPDMPEAHGSLPSGGLVSSAEDMAHYLIAHLNAGRYREVQILSQAGMDAMHHGANVLFMVGQPTDKYGMGWFDMDLGQTKIYTHGGNVPDFSAFAAFLPQHKLGLVLLLNADPYGLPPVTAEIGMGAAALLAGQQPEPVKLDFIQWIMRLLPLIPLLQLASVFATLRQVHVWQRFPEMHPSRGRLWVRHILLPTLPNLALATGLEYLLSSGLLGFFYLFIPDLAWTARLCGGFASVWAFFRSGLILRTLHQLHP